MYGVTLPLCLAQYFVLNGGKKKMLMEGKKTQDFFCGKIVQKSSPSIYQLERQKLLIWARINFMKTMID